MQLVSPMIFPKMQFYDLEGAFQQELGADLDIERLSKELSGDT
jgi:hypothetical protein